VLKLRHYAKPQTVICHPKTSRNQAESEQDVFPDHPVFMDGVKKGKQNTQPLCLWLTGMCQAEGACRSRYQN